MTPLEQSILQSLETLEAAAAARSQPAAEKPPLLPILQRLDQLTRELPPETSPDLRHYLQRGSYQKARLLLAGQDPESDGASRPPCGGH